ncbi:MAG: hypothetical protein JST75_00275 [Bacteroidetes bacterium]|nr:hypothetical protein [Bacteroidota bacterium]
MKKLMLIMSVVLVAGFTQAFADKGKEKEVNQQANASFTKDFSTAKNASWEQYKNYVKVTFTLNNQVMYAYYSNESGHLMAVSRNITSEQLPINLMTSLRKDYKGYWISDLFEMASDGQTSYYVTLQNADETVVLKSSGSDWNVFKTTAK